MWWKCGIQEFNHLTSNNYFPVLWFMLQLSSIHFCISSDRISRNQVVLQYYDSKFLFDYPFISTYPHLRYPLFWIHDFDITVAAVLIWASLIIKNHPSYATPTRFNSNVNVSEIHLNIPPSPQHHAGIAWNHSYNWKFDVSSKASSRLWIRIYLVGEDSVYVRLCTS